MIETSAASTSRSGRTLARPTFVNALPVNPGRISDAAIDRLNGLRSGSYIGGRVSVVVVRNDNGSPEVWIWFLDRTVAARRENAQFWNSLDDMLDKVTAEADTRNAR